MFKSKSKQEPKQQKNTEVLSNSELQQLKSAFADITLSSQKITDSNDEPWNQSSQISRETPLLRTYRRVTHTLTFFQIKQTFYDINSRSFKVYSYFSSRLNIGKQLDHRPQLLRIDLTANALQILAVCVALFFPKKYVYKILFTSMVLTVENQFIQKLKLNYIIQSFAIHNNKMQPIEQQARNLIEYKYRIHNLAQDKKRQEIDPEIQKLLQEVDRKNIEYLKYKKVQLLL